MDINDKLIRTYYNDEKNNLKKEFRKQKLRICRLTYYKVK